MGGRERDRQIGGREWKGQEKGRWGGGWKGYFIPPRDTQFPLVLLVASERMRSERICFHLLARCSKGRRSVATRVSRAIVLCKLQEQQLIVFVLMGLRGLHSRPWTWEDMRHLV